MRNDNNPIQFHVPHRAGHAVDYLAKAFSRGHLRGDGPFSRQVEKWIENETGCTRAVLTGSCTAAMEMAALALNLTARDEVIVPSFTFCATATAFERTGARIVFCDIDPSTLMIDPDDLSKRITERTRAIVVVHYGGASADMERICRLAEQGHIHVVEDAAQGFGATRDGRALGTFGTFGAYSFHETKVVSCGQGGALLTNTRDPNLLARLETIVERGTDFAEVRKGAKQFYEWAGPGSSFRLGELEAALLLAECEALKENIARRRQLASLFFDHAKPNPAVIEFLRPDEATCSNFHFIGGVAANENLAGHLMACMRAEGIDVRQHYAPLHMSPHARKHSYAPAQLAGAAQAWRRLVRFPLHTFMQDADMIRCADALNRAASQA